MALELVIAGRRPLPKRDKPWTFELAYDGDDDDDGMALEDEPHDGILDEGSFDLYEVDVTEDAEFRTYVVNAVGFEPAVIVCIRPAAWEMSTIAAEIVAQAVEGVVFCFPDALDFDAKGAAQPAKTLKQIEQRILDAFEHPAPYFERWEREAKEEYADNVAKDPVLAAENDWSDL